MRIKTWVVRDKDGVPKQTKHGVPRIYRSYATAYTAALSLSYCEARYRERGRWTCHEAILVIDDNSGALEDDWS